MRDPDRHEATDLIARVCDRDPAAFEAIYDQYHRLVYRVAHRVLQDDQAAEDVTQSVFASVWSSPASFRGGSFIAWLGRVARNRAIDAVRRVPRERELTMEVPFHEDVEERALLRIDSQRALVLIGALPPAQRKAIELAFFGGLTYLEIAVGTSTPLGTVKTRIRTGLRALRAGLTETVG